MAREAMAVYLRVLKESNKSRFDSYSVLIISHITFRDCRVQFFFPTTFLEISVYKEHDKSRGIVYSSRAL